MSMYGIPDDELAIHQKEAEQGEQEKQSSSKVAVVGTEGEFFMKQVRKQSSKVDEGKP